MSIKDQALRAINQLPDDCTWDEVLFTLTRASGAGPRWPAQVREFQPSWGGKPARETREEEEGGMSYDFDVVVERDAEGVYVGSVPALQGCHTQAPSLEQLMERVREAVELCLEVSGGRVSETGFVGIRRVSVTA